MTKKQISFLEAKDIAIDFVKDDIFNFLKLKDILPPYLSDYYLETEGCWMFFRRENIILPEKTLVDCAYVVSKKGEARGVVNYRNNPEKAKEYLEKISNYFLENNL